MAEQIYIYLEQGINIICNGNRILSKLLLIIQTKSNVYLGRYYDICLNVCTVCNVQ